MFLKLLVLFTAIPLIDLFVLIKVGSLMGALPTIAIVFITGITGAALAKYEGTKCLAGMKRALGEGRLPGDEIIAGLVILVGSATLLTPGFITDIFGFFMLVPFTRRPVVRLLKGWIVKKIEQGQWRTQVNMPFVYDAPAPPQDVTVTSEPVTPNSHINQLPH